MGFLGGGAIGFFAGVGAPLLSALLCGGHCMSGLEGPAVGLGAGGGLAAVGGLAAGVCVCVCVCVLCARNSVHNCMQKHLLSAFKNFYPL